MYKLMIFSMPLEHKYIFVTLLDHIECIPHVPVVDMLNILCKNAVFCATVCYNEYFCTFPTSKCYDNVLYYRLAITKTILFG